VIDGPFAETKELIAGYHVIDVASLEEAIAWTRKWPPEDGGGRLELEIRPIITAEDFGPEFTAQMHEAREHLDRLA